MFLQPLLLRFRPYLLSGFCFFPLAGAWAQTLTPTPTPKPLNLSPDAFQLTVPFVEQKTPSQCGLAVAEMLGRYYNLPLDQAQTEWLQKNSEERGGNQGADLFVVLKAAGFDTAVFPGTLDQESTGLYFHLRKRRPVIIMITSKDLKNSHYDVVTGYDPRRSRILLLDPALGPLAVDIKDFLPAWKRANFFTLVAVPRQLMEKTPTAIPGR